MDQNKPTIFLSHSSRDKQPLVRLKSALARKTGETLDTFLSTDGQSIQLGRNWVHKIEDALDRARIVFVFVSPNSLQSKWLYFESGFSYAKDIRVIPIAIGGVDLQTVPPPLGLLQGFNVRDHEGLNNIIQIINGEFKYSFEESFTPEEYSAIFYHHDRLATSGFGAFTALIHSIEFRFENASQQPLETVRNRLQETQIQFQEVKEHIHSYGLSFWSDRPQRLHISADPSLVGLTFPIIQDVCHHLSVFAEGIYAFRLDFEPGVGSIKEHYRATSKAFSAGITLGTENKFKYRNMEFLVDEFYMPAAYPKQIYLTLALAQEQLDSKPVVDLLEILFEHEILFLPDFKQDVWPQTTA